MIRRQRLLLALLALAGAAALAGCTAKPKEESSIPWSRPASWEGQAPGFGGFGSPGVR
ncbi:MAG: hypothetical protein ABII82_08025 [Verrucomicrobiota bacterium]|jgi:hypothetical protein